MDATLLFAILAGFLLFAGLVGSFLPILPGPPLAWAGLFAAHFSNYSKISVPILIITGIVALVVTIADNIFPAILTKKAGGSKAASWGSTLGLIIGILFAPTIISLILCPFLGALIGELVHDSTDGGKAFKAACGAFVGFMLGTGVKAITVCVFIWLFIVSLSK